MRTLLFFVFVFVAANKSFAFELSEKTCANQIDCAKRSVVSLLPDWPAGFTRNEEPEGSGIVVGDGNLIATADHVLGPANTAKIRTHDGMVMNASIVLRDALTDIALLRPARKLKPFSEYKTPNVADRACSIGNAFGLDLSVSCGVISATDMSGVGFNPIEDFIQSDTAVNPGMSGGALVSDDGTLIGMLSAIFTRQSDANIGVNFAVSSNLLLKVVSQYEETGSVKHRRPGIALKPNDPASSEGLQGALVTRVVNGSPEAAAGLQTGDIVIIAGNRRIKRKGAYEAAIALAGNRKDFDILLIRGKNKMTVTLKFD